MKPSVPILALALLLGSAGPAAAEPGPEVGATPPSFELPDQHGTPRSLASLLGRGKLAVVFFRSADW